MAKIAYVVKQQAIAVMVPMNVLSAMAMVMAMVATMAAWFQLGACFSGVCRYMNSVALAEFVMNNRAIIRRR
ncbi:hypothetical protein WME94_26365 [Sorangium sp. So ce429]